MSDAANDFLTIKEVAKHPPKSRSISTVWRWILEGILRPDGQRSMLKSEKFAGRRFVRRADLADFLRPTRGSSRLATDDNDGCETRRGDEAGQALEDLGA